MANGHHNLYISTVISYTSGNAGGLPTSLSIEEVLFDLMPASRYKIADRQADGMILIVQEHR